VLIGQRSFRECPHRGFLHRGTAVYGGRAILRAWAKCSAMRRSRHRSVISLAPC